MQPVVSSKKESWSLQFFPPFPFHVLLPYSRKGSGKCLTEYVSLQWAIQRLHNVPKAARETQLGKRRLRTENPTSTTCSAEQMSSPAPHQTIKQAGRQDSLDSFDNLEDIVHIPSQVFPFLRTLKQICSTIILMYLPCTSRHVLVLINSATFTSILSFFHTRLSRASQSDHDGQRLYAKHAEKRRQSHSTLFPKHLHLPA